MPNNELLRRNTRFKCTKRTNYDSSYCWFNSCKYHCSILQQRREKGILISGEAGLIIHQTFLI
jgi:hypothetical protein